MIQTIDVDAYMDRFRARMDAADAKEAMDFPYHAPITKRVANFDVVRRSFSEQEKWCYANCKDRFKFSTRIVGSSSAPTAVARFKFASDRDATLFKLFWQEGE